VIGVEIWPQIVLEDGPPLAGLDVGDRIAFPPDRALVFYEQPLLITTVGPRERATGEHWCVNSATRSVEYKPAAGGWGPARAQPEGAHVRGSDVVSVRGRRFRILVDGPALATVKEVAPNVRAAHATSLRCWSAGDAGTVSTWLQVSRRMRTLVEVEQRERGAPRVRVHTRAVGVSLDELYVLAEAHPFEREVAAGIATRVRDGEPNVAVSFDGEVNSPSAKAEGGPLRAEVYAKLAYARQPAHDEIGALTRELDATAPASSEQLRAIVRGLFPQECAREEALVEECKVLAG
jgi:hypothetical protein